MPEGKSTVPTFDAVKWKGIIDEWKKEESNHNDAKGKHKILIVGAGSAGLYAAYTLQYLGFEDYEILEASDTIGGRLSENSSFIDLPLDEGAEWIHFSKPRILQDLLLDDNDNDEPFEVEVLPYRPQTWKFFANGKNHQRNFLRHMHKVYVEHKFKSTTWFSYLEKYIFDRIPKEKLHLNTAVKSIDSSDPVEVKITTADGSVFTGTHVIVAVSVGVLQADVISFLPPMPTPWTNELKKINFAQGFKAWFEMKERFYPDFQAIGPVTGVFNPTSEAIYMDGVFGKPTSANVLTTLQIGKIAARRSQLTDDELKKELLKELDEIYGGKASECLVRSAVKNWSAEPYIRGTYSTSIWHNKKLLRTGVPGKILFAGEHLGSPQIAVQGAMLSGRFAVEALLLSSSLLSPDRNNKASTRKGWFSSCFGATT